MRFCLLPCFVLCVVFSGRFPAHAQSPAPTAPVQGAVPAQADRPEVDRLTRRIREAESPEAMRIAFEQLRTRAASVPLASLACGLLAAQPGSPLYDRETALECLQRASRAGIAEAQYRTAKLLLAGSPTSAERSQAMKLLAASANEVPESVYELALAQAAQAPNPVAAKREVLERMATAGFALAQFELAQLRYAEGTASGRAAALAWLEKAAQGGHAEALTEIALVLAASGRDVDVARVVALLQQAALAGSPRANYELARRYQNALGVKRDTEKAYELAQTAAHAGYAPGQYLVGTLLGQGIGAGANEAAAAAWFRLAADQGDVDAMFALGTSYANGWGVGRSRDLANRWHCRAALAGHVGAQALFVRQAPTACPGLKPSGPPTGS